MQRYKGYLVPIDSVKRGSLLKELADREKTILDGILQLTTEPGPQE